MIAKRISELDLQLFRPGLRALLSALLEAKKNNRIAGCFILTNNGSWELAEVVRQTLNLMVNHELFVVAWDRYSPCRDGTENPKKNLATIQACLANSGLPTLKSVNDLLFYDDQEHVLESEIPNYIRVAEYVRHVPVDLVYNKIKPVLDRQEIPQDVRTSVLRIAHRYEKEDRVRPTPIVEIPLKTLQNFLQVSRNTRRVGGRRKTRGRKRVDKRVDKN